MEIREITQVGHWIRSYGSIDCGLDMMGDAWQTLEHVFSVNKLHLRELHPSTQLYEGPRFKLSLLVWHQIDMLVVERGHVHKPHSCAHKEERWEQLISRVEVPRRPKIVVESWDAAASLWPNGPVGQASRTRWDALEFVTRSKVVNATHIGGAIRQKRLLVTRIHAGTGNVCPLWPEDNIRSTTTTAERPMSNLLIPPGLIPKSAYKNPPEILGMDPDVSPMPTFQAWIRTTRGTRRLLLPELARGLGLDKTTTEGLANRLTPGILQQTTSVYHWEYLSA